MDLTQDIKESIIRTVREAIENGAKLEYLPEDTGMQIDVELENESIVIEINAEAEEIFEVANGSRVIDTEEVVHSANGPMVREREVEFDSSCHDLEDDHIKGFLDETEYVAGLLTHFECYANSGKSKRTWDEIGNIHF